MISKPFFSVIIPVYNVADYIEKAIESVISQNFDSFELILVDDGSSDECPTICEHYKELNSKIIVIHKENGGVVSARQAGASVASGLYTICLDGDDWLREDALTKIASSIRDNDYPDIICFGIINSYVSSNVETVIRNRPGYYSKEMIVRDIFPMLIQKENATYFAPSLCGKAIKTDLYLTQQMQVPLDIVIGEDGACTIPCVFHANSLYIMEDYLYYYRQNASSLTKNRAALSWNIPVNNANHLINTIDINLFDFREQLYRKICHDTFLVIVSSFYSNDSFFSIRKQILVELRNRVISDAIQNASFHHSFKATLMMLMIRCKLFFPFKIYSMI